MSSAKFGSAYCHVFSNICDLASFIDTLRRNLDDIFINFFINMNPMFVFDCVIDLMHQLHSYKIIENRDREKEANCLL